MLTQQPPQLPPVEPRLTAHLKRIRAIIQQECATVRLPHRRLQPKYFRDHPCVLGQILQGDMGSIQMHV